MDKHTSNASYITSVCTAVAGGVTLQEFALVIGIVATIGTFLVNWYYKHKEFKHREAGCEVKY